MDPDPTDFILSLQQDRMAAVRAHARYLCTSRSRLLVIVLDNCDKRDRDDQLLMFQLAQWLQAQVKSLIILPIRDTTYDLHRLQPPLDTALKDLVFRIEPPQFTKVLSGRVALALSELVGRDGEKLNYTLPNSIRVVYPASDQGMYLACILRSLYEHDRFVRQVMSGLAGRDIRRAIEIFVDFCQSGYISEGEILKIRMMQGNYSLPFSVVSAVLLRMHRRFYDGDVSYVKNLFQADRDDTPLDHFIRPAILRRLQQLRSVERPAGVRGFHPVRDIVRFLATHGHSAERALEEMGYLLSAGCITAEHLRVDSLSEDDLVSLSANGAVHLELISSVHYLAACAEDAWLSDRNVAERVRDRIVRTRLAHLSELAVVRNARDLLDYLERTARDRLAPTTSFLNTSDEYDVRSLLDDATRAVEQAELDVRRAARSGRVFVGNLAYDATEDDVVEAFSSAGFEVVDVYILRDKATGESRGSAFVSFGDEATVTAAITNLTGLRVCGRPIRLDLPKPR